MRSSPKLLANFSNQKVGYEPLRIERETREELLRNWREDAELELSELVDDSDFDENEGQIELKSQSLRNLKEKTENKGGLGSTFTEMFTHAQSKYFVSQQSQSEHVIVEDLEVKIGLDDNGLGESAYRLVSINSYRIDNFERPILLFVVTCSRSLNVLVAIIFNFFLTSTSTFHTLS